MSTKGNKVDKRRYQKLVRKLIYLSLTRPDISFSIRVVSQFVHYPMEEHLEAVYQILQYLKKNPSHGLMFKKGGGDLTIEVELGNGLDHPVLAWLKRAMGQNGSG